MFCDPFRPICRGDALPAPGRGYWTWRSNEVWQRSRPGATALPAGFQAIVVLTPGNLTNYGANEKCLLSFSLQVSYSIGHQHRVARTGELSMTTPRKLTRRRFVQGAAAAATFSIV